MNAKQSKNDRDYYFEQIGGNFDRWMSDYDVYRRAVLIRKHLGQKALNKSCLEVGCGTGKISEAVADVVGTLTVSDISEKLAREAGQKLNVPWMQQDACALNIPDNSFDVVISSECIEHTPDPERALCEMTRVLKPGGLIVVTSPNKAWYPVLWLSMVTGVRRFAGRENWLFPSAAARILKSEGVREVHLDGCHLFPWQIPLAKRILPLFDRAGESLYPIMINFCVTGIKQPLL
ncbi:MAG: class I SAM-dependent methyltransferase [Deltaproteobacteria bacterium]|nr:MAG: class I SAM-dependent methyltransferase [Deltaproteobacteria bacterium]